MIDGIRIKVCGLTSIVDAEFADRCGVDYLGFNLYPKSPRYVSLETFRAMEPRLPDRKKVAVSVEPTLTDLAAMKSDGFDFFQIHFRHDLPPENVAAWSEAVGADRLWLAPKLPPAIDVPPNLLPLAKFFLLDTFHADKFGGTGETGDWAKFARHQLAHAEKTWILSGGLNPNNISDALRESGANFVDVNSGVESAPGVKDEAKLKRFVVRLHESRT
ncbi:MAG: phosphoribosylanthranilate isomerase [Opitutaceae bacterium]